MVRGVMEHVRCGVLQQRTDLQLHSESSNWGHAAALDLVGFLQPREKPATIFTLSNKMNSIIFNSMKPVSFHGNRL